MQLKHNDGFEIKLLWKQCQTRFARKGMAGECVCVLVAAAATTAANFCVGRE